MLSSSLLPLSSPFFSPPTMALLPPPPSSPSYHCSSPILLPSDVFKTDFELDKDFFFEEEEPRYANITVNNFLPTISPTSPSSFIPIPVPSNTTPLPSSFITPPSCISHLCPLLPSSTLPSAPLISPQSSPKKKNSRKNIFRYMTRRIIRGLIGDEFEGKVKEICMEIGVSLEEVRRLYRAKIESFTSIAELRKEWSDQNNGLKRVFRIFSKWFLKNRAIRYILEGKMVEKLEFIKYKNHVLLKYIDHPERYFRNK